MPNKDNAAAALSASVDVIIPVYNCERFIRQALASVVSQDYAPNKIIVVDDGSTDATAALVQGFVSPVPIQYLYKSNGGPNSARNAGMAHSTSDYLAFLDADDEWFPEKLSRQLQLFESGELHDLAAVYCQYLVIDDGGQICPDAFIVALDPANRGRIFDRLLAANTITGSASGIMIRRECLDRVGEFDESLRGGEDWDMWLRLAQQYQFDYVAEKLVKIRRHSSNAQRDSLLMFRNSLMFYNKWSASAVRFGHHVVWRNVIVSKIARDLPSLESYRLTGRILSEETRGHLFQRAAGSIILFILSKGWSVFTGEAKRILRLR